MQVRYSSTSQALHWLTVLCMFAIWVMTSMPLSAPARAGLFAWHETLGLIVLIVTAFRILWRSVDKPPPYPPRVARWERTLAHAAYWLFFLLLPFMPVTGFLTATYGGHPVRLFNLVLVPAVLAKDDSHARFFTSLHLLGQWAVYALIALHLSAVVVHLIWARTGLLGRMLPADATNTGQARENGQSRPRPAGQLAPVATRTLASRPAKA